MISSVSDSKTLSIEVLLSKENIMKEVMIDQGEDLIGLMKVMGMPVDGVLVLEEGAPIPLDRPLTEVRSRLTIINVSSGG